MLGWHILEQGQYRLDIPVLGQEEEELILAAQERFKESARTREPQADAGGRELVCRMLEQAARERGVYVDRHQQEYLGAIAFMHICGFAFMDELLADNSVEEISVIGPNLPIRVFIRKAGWKSVNACFDDEKSIADMVNRMSRSLGRHITMQNPRLDAMLPDGSRLHASLPPVSCGEITIRRFRERPFSPAELIQNKTIDAGAMAYLSIIMQCDFSILIAGNTASGKTTTLNALFSFVPHNERIIITEETPEINVPHAHQLRLVASREMGITLKDLVYDSLRMRPDRMIVGEVRNKEEAEALFDVLLAGQARGSYATFHAQSAAEALSRLRSFGVREEDMRSIDCIAIQRRALYYDAKKRTATEGRQVTEIMDAGEGKVVYRPGGKIGCGGLLGRAAESFGLSQKEMEGELRSRKRLIESAPAGFTEFYGEIQKKLYGAGVSGNPAKGGGS
ncbi:Flp pilus assembly complex ATPase component TadA [Candidatus Micrarchaeota archaeon]|nr:Flp pilus assembly complex ATPase component TadA [Candidatus Micrarchaeota archaeon]